MDATSALLAVALHAGLNGLIALALAANAGKIRGETGISIGDGGNPDLIRAMRGQANFIESVPVALTLLLIMALIGGPVWLLHVLGGMLTLGRACHAAHFILPDAPLWQRQVGSLLSMLVLLIGSIGLVGHALYGII